MARIHVAQERKELIERFHLVELGEAFERAFTHGSRNAFPRQQRDEHRRGLRHLDQVLGLDAAEDVRHPSRIIGRKRLALRDGRLPVRLERGHRFLEGVVDVVVAGMLEREQGDLGGLGVPEEGEADDGFEADARMFVVGGIGPMWDSL